MIIGTAGHIDHGKTSLVRALTGVDTDRLPEEKRRGITIALGFAPLQLPPLGTVGVVDVPGHEAFVRTMLAGASGIDCALIVVAADEGVMPQTREHLAILQLLAVPRAVVALTKADVADADLLVLVTMDVEELLKDTPLAGSPVVAVSALTGDGIDALRAELVKALQAAPVRDASDAFRLPVDRVFSIAGAGTVVTGTAWSGALSVGDAVHLLPQGRDARVRSIETHGAAVTRSNPGARLAIAVAGVDRADVATGAVLVRADDAWRPTRVLRADVHLLPGAPTVGLRTRLSVHMGTSECQGRIVAVGGRVAPGKPTPVRVVLDEPVVTRAGDHFVLRGGTPFTTLGGGVVTDPLPPTPRARPWPSLDADPKQRLAWMLSEAGAAGLDLRELPLRLGVRDAELEKMLKSVKGTARVGDRVVESVVLEQLRGQLIARIEQAHRDAPLAPGLDRQTARRAISPSDDLADEVIRRAERAGLIEVAGSALRIPGFDPALAASAGDAKGRLLETLLKAGSEPPSVDELATTFGKDVVGLLKLLGHEKAAIPVSIERWFAAAAVDALLAKLRVGTEPARSYSPSELREILGISRKYLIPFLEWCDRQGISRRLDEGRTFPGIPR